MRPRRISCGSTAPAPAAHLAAAGGIIAVVDEDGGLYGLDAATGKEKWRWDDKLGRFNARVAPVVVDGVAYLMSADQNPGNSRGTLIAIDIASGKRLWESDARDAISAPTVADGVVYICTNNPPAATTQPADKTPRGADTLLEALDAKTGKKVWDLTVSKGAGVAGGRAPGVGGGGAPGVGGGRATRSRRRRSFSRRHRDARHDAQDSAVPPSCSR